MQTTYVRDAPLASFCNARRRSQSSRIGSPESNSETSLSDESFSGGPIWPASASSIPGGFGLEKLPKLGIISWRAVEQNGKSPELLFREREIATVEQYRLRLPAGC